MKIENVPFPDVARRLQKFANPLEFNPHHGLLAGTRSGKSYLIRNGILTDTDFSRVVVIDVKTGGALTWNGWGNDVTELPPGFGRGPDGTAHYRMLMQRGDAGKDQISRFLDMIINEGHCIIVIDDSRQVTSNSPGLGMRDHVDELLTIGAETGISVILAANSTVWATSTLRDQCGAYWIGLARNTKEQRAFASYAGLSPNEVMPVLSKLKPRQFLYSDQYDGEISVCVTGL